MQLHYYSTFPVHIKFGLRLPTNYGDNTFRNNDLMFEVDSAEASCLTTLKFHSVARYQ